MPSNSATESIYLCFGFEIITCNFRTISHTIRTGQLKHDVLSTADCICALGLGGLVLRRWLAGVGGILRRQGEIACSRKSPVKPAALWREPATSSDGFQLFHLISGGIVLGFCVFPLFAQQVPTRVKAFLALLVMAPLVFVLAITLMGKGADFHC